ncbi:MAG: electron transfer flavoprotein subunit beta/FixA family protein [Balneolales bacterium]|nr:electron transfer flavoprotein subunit beta/FixA family protein [Balneolales bacterium]
MKFSVCIKQVPDVSAPLTIKDGNLSQDTDRMVLDAYSASAVEEALVLTDKHGGDVEVVLVGPDKAKETIRKALAMGAATGVHIVVENTSGLDSAAFAEILAAWHKKSDYDVILTGKQSQDTDAGLTGGMLAWKLGLPYAANAVGLTYDEAASAIVVKRQGDSGQEMVELKTPCLVTCSNDMNDPRIPSLKGIMQSKRKKVETVQLSDLGLELDALSGTVSQTQVHGFKEVPGREPGKKFEGDAEELVSNLMNLLENEAKVL